MRWEEIIVELARVKPDTAGWLFELACYPKLKEIFGELEAGYPFDFKVKGKSIYIEVKKRGWPLHEKQIDFVMETEADFYIACLEEHFTDRLEELGDVKHRFETLFGTVVVLKLNIEVFRGMFEEEYRQRKLYERYLKKVAEETLWRLVMERP